MTGRSRPAVHSTWRARTGLTRSEGLNARKDEESLSAPCESGRDRCW